MSIEAIAALSSLFLTMALSFGVPEPKPDRQAVFMLNWMMIWILSYVLIFGFLVAFEAVSESLVRVLMWL